MPLRRAMHAPSGRRFSSLRITRNPRGTGRILARRAHPGAVIVLHEGHESRAAVSAAADAMVVVLAQRNLRAITLSELATVPMDHGC